MNEIYEMYKSLYMIIVRDVHICCTCSHRTTSTNCCRDLTYEMYKYVVHDYRTRCTNMLYMLSSYEMCKYVVHALIVRKVQFAVHDYRTRCTNMLYMIIVRDVQICCTCSHRTKGTIRCT